MIRKAPEYSDEQFDQFGEEVDTPLIVIIVAGVVLGQFYERSSHGIKEQRNGAEEHILGINAEAGHYSLSPFARRWATAVRASGSRANHK